MENLRCKGSSVMMSSSLKLVSLALLSVNVSCFPGPDLGAHYNISKAVWATEREVSSSDHKKGKIRIYGTDRSSRNDNVWDKLVKSMQSVFITLNQIFKGL